ncbi:MAG: hypothetical protein JF571_12580 [Asticcacaulis sp.]|nr:hypothetical protein [Asticcacaulis sp.]
MTKSFIPDETYFLMRWIDLEAAWRMLASPNRQADIDEVLHTLQTLDRNPDGGNAVFTMVAATAWLTDDGARPADADAAE